MVELCYTARWISVSMRCLEDDGDEEDRHREGRQRWGWGQALSSGLFVVPCNPRWAGPKWGSLAGSGSGTGTEAQAEVEARAIAANTDLLAFLGTSSPRIAVGDAFSSSVLRRRAARFLTYCGGLVLVFEVPDRIEKRAEPRAAKERWPGSLLAAQETDVRGVATGTPLAATPAAPCTFCCDAGPGPRCCPTSCGAVCKHDGEAQVRVVDCGQWTQRYFAAGALRFQSTACGYEQLPKTCVAS
jgi:hypothetical protein